VSPVAAFVRECCDVGPHEIAKDDLYRKWKEWSDENGHKVTASSTFGRDLRSVVPALQTVRPREPHEGTPRPRVWRGIRLSPRTTVTRSLDQPGPDPHHDPPVQAGPRTNPLSPHSHDNLDAKDYGAWCSDLELDL
jgi:hypothetical protein